MSKKDYDELITKDTLENIPEIMTHMIKSREFALKRQEWYSNGKSDTDEFKDFILKELNEQHQLIDLINSKMQDFADKIKVYAKFDFVEDLKTKHSWFLPEEWYIEESSKYFKAPCLLKAMENSECDRHIVDDLIVSITEQNNWEFLDFLVAKWGKEVELFNEDRVQILKDCITAIKKLTRSESANIILPTLIAQIEGVWLDLLINKGVNIEKVTTPKGKQRNFVMTDQKEELKKLLDVTETYHTVAFDFLDNRLFCDNKSMDGDLEFRRHKIMHGRDANYGNIASVIKAFFMLDYLYRIGA